MNYEIISKEQFSKNCLEKSNLGVVYGGYFGDEAKGKTVASFTPDLIARVNSGENAGHTVIFNNKKYVFHLVPSGILNKNKNGKPVMNLIGSNCVMDPISLFETEIQPLIDDGINYDNLKIGNPSIVTPYHKLYDAITSGANGSTLKGMSPVHSDMVRKKDFKLEDIINENWTSFDKNLEDTFKLFETLGFDENKIEQEFGSHEKLPQYIKDFVKIKGIENKKDFMHKKYKEFVTNNTDFPEIANTEKILADYNKEGKFILLEGPQSYFLSNGCQAHHFKSTSANTNSAGIIAASGLNNVNYFSIGVIKTPSSRVGSGANPAGYVEQDWFANKNMTKPDLENFGINYNQAYKEFIETIDENGIQDSTKSYTGDFNSDGKLEKLTVNEAFAISSSLQHGEFGATTGKPRIVGSVDLPHLKYIIDSGEKNISISAIDRLTGLEKVPVVIGYEYTGNNYSHFGKIYKSGDRINLEDSLPNEKILQNCKPIYKVLNGWNSIEENGKLNSNLDKFLNYVSKKTGANIVSIGTGPKTDQMIYLNKN